MRSDIRVRLCARQATTISLKMSSTGLSMHVCILMVLLSGPVQLCPTNCKFCSTGLADCTQVSSLQEVLTGLPVVTEKILLRAGTLDQIPAEAFRNFSNLNVLSINEFPISTLLNYSFAIGESNRLQYLDLSNNRLTSCGIEALAFTGPNNLTEFTLTNNALDTLYESWFNHLVRLEKLNLASNRIPYLPPRIFENLSQLQELNVSSNNIRYLSSGTFLGMSNLVELDLSGNGMIFINNDAFNPLMNLMRIALFQNGLETLPDVPDSTHLLQLHDNPWQCTCALVQLLQRLKDKVQSPERVVCATPSEVQGSPFLSAYQTVCNLNSTESGYPTSSPQNQISRHLWIYGFIGGFVLAFLICVVGCVIRKHWKQRGVTNPVNPIKESGTSLHENAPVGELIENKLWTDAMHSQNPPSSGLSCTRLNEFKSQHASGVSDGAHDLQNHEAELEGSCQERDGIRLCKTAPGTLPAAGVVHQVTNEKTQIVNDTKSIDLVKYFETEFAHHIEIPPKDPSTAKHKPYLHDAGNISAEIQRTSNNAPNLKDDGVMKNPSSKRSKTWNNLHFGNQGLSFEEDGNRITRCNIEVNNFSESKNDKPYNKQGGTGKGLHLLKDYETSIDSLSSKTDNTLQYGDLGYSNEVFEDMMWRHITGQPDGSDGEGNLCRSWVENEKGSPEIKEVPTYAEGRCAMPLPSQDKDAESTSHQHNGFKIKNSISLPVMQGSTNQGQWRLEPTHRDSSQMFYFGVPKLVNVQPAFNANPMPVPSLYKLAGTEEDKAERVVCIQPCNETECLPAMQTLHEEQEETRNAVTVLSEAALTDKHDAHVTNTSSQIQSKMKLEGESFIKSVDNLSSNIKDPQSCKSKEAFMADSESVHENDLNSSPRLHGFQGRSSSLDDMRHSKEIAVLQNNPWYQNALLENKVGIQLEGGVSKAGMVLKSPDVFLENNKKGVLQNKEEVFPIEKLECDKETTTTEKCIDPNELKKDDIEIHQRRTHEDLFSTMVMEDNDQEVDEATPTMDHLYFSGKPTASFNMEMTEKSGRSSPNAEEKVTHKNNGVPVGNIFDLSNSNLQKSALKYKLQDATDSMQCHKTIGTLDDMHCFASDQQQKNREGFFKSNDESNKDHNGCLREWRIKNQEAKESHEFSSHFAHDTADAAQIQLEESIAPVQTKPMKKSYVSVFKLPIAMARVSQSSQKNGPMETGAGKSLDLDGITPVDCDRSKINSILTSLPPDAAGENDNAQTRQTSGSFKNASGLAIHQEKFHKYWVKSKFSDTIETLLPEVDEISALNNLHYEKIRGKRIHNIAVQEHRPTALIHDEDFDTSSTSPSPARYAQQTPPKRGELLEDDELAVINVLCQLKKSLKGQAHIQL